ncbi:hypothetical protein LTR86_001018 [Recurvomyces mirabilis]|nr:hypothetical protein LTR86_001018 [Recurvomyces mirabilis]
MATVEATTERPPAYTATDPNSPSGTATASNNAIDQQVHTFEIYTTHTGLNVTNSRHQLYYIRHYEIADHADLIIYGGYDYHGPQLSMVKFTPFQKNFEVYLGGLKRPGKQDWDAIRFMPEGTIFHHDFYRFELPADTSVTGSRKRNVHFTKTHSGKLGASKFSIRDFKLVDESDDTVLGVYTEHDLGIPGTLKGKLKFCVPVGSNAELHALTVVMALIERMRRTLRQGGRMAPGYVLK